MAQSYCGQVDEKGLTKHIAAIWTTIPNKTFQFLFIDNNYNQISFNTDFINEFKDRFPEAMKLINKGALNRVEEDVNDKTDTKPHFLEEEPSSDEDIKPVMYQPNLEKLKE